uniref:Protein Rev n=1 Tax=Simian immunodeficiency virus agm.vervet (isolate AGM3) TaxID=11730 RepID=REV_SIVVG|nr:RecName: Full=Protein Rev; AltName: Full=Regulator of expression of viral proteins [Simian immunodeficiency virus (AGM3 ISOLATE)]AAA91918.1 rev protein [Simian immunodeficiency virus]
MPLGSEERRLLRLIAFLNKNNPYPPVEGTARQRRRARRRWRQAQEQLRALAERIWHSRVEEQLVQAIDQLVLDQQHLAIQQLPDPPSSS